MTVLMDLPAELLRKIIGMLSLPDRARAEAVSKTFLEFSRTNVDSARILLPASEDPLNLAEWLQRLGKKSLSNLQNLALMLYAPFEFCKLSST